MTDNPYFRSYRAPVLAEVEDFLRRYAITPTQFGMRAIGDPNLVYQLRAGRDPRSKTVAIIRRFMEAADMGMIHRHPASQPNMPAVARILSRYDRESLEAFLMVALDLLDTMDGDPDQENATDLEDDFTLTEHARGYGSRGPGCPLADAGGQCDEDEINTAFPSASGPGCPISDPGGGNVEDEPQEWFIQPYTGPLDPSNPWPPRPSANRGSVTEN